jgi:hypothetical protein
MIENRASRAGASGEASGEMVRTGGHMHVHERDVEKKRLNGLMLKSPMKVYRAFGEIGKQVFADGAISKKHKELTALAVAVSQNCFD